MIIGFIPESAENFSFYDENKEYSESCISEIYELNKNDRNIELSIMTLTITGANKKLPYDITVGESTKVEILDAYPKDTGYIYQNETEDYYYNGISYDYGFRDESGDLPVWNGGGISYILDKNDVLEEVYIWWRYYCGC
jgi:hypothetical protein